MALPVDAACKDCSELRFICMCSPSGFSASNRMTRLKCDTPIWRALSCVKASLSLGVILDVDVARQSDRTRALLNAQRIFPLHAASERYQIKPATVFRGKYGGAQIRPAFVQLARLFGRGIM